MSFDEHILRLKSLRKKCKREHKKHLKKYPHTRSWYKKASVLKSNRVCAKRNLVNYRKKIKNIKKNREKISELLEEYNVLQLNINKDVNTMYNSLENIASCSNHSSVQHLLRQSINAYVREQPNRFQNSLTHVWAYDNSSRNFNTLDKKIDSCQTQLDTLRMDLSTNIKDLD